MNEIPGWKKKPFWIRLLHWEYWSFNVIYIPIYPVFIFLCLRARSFFFYAAANPTIKYGGFLGESKKQIYSLIPPALQPVTLFFQSDTPPLKVLEQLDQAGFQYPMIGKPDMGARGRGVKKLDDESAVELYVTESKNDFHIQEYIPFENEAGIFYYRFPGESKGDISGFVHKQFLTVRGDGKQSIRDLLINNPRAILQLTTLEREDPDMLLRVIAQGELFTVVPYGNHARGAMFLDDSASVSSGLVDILDDICKQIPEFYFGRLDIRYKSRELLEKGKSFSIIEVNGAGSEPTHMYDPKHSLFFAWKEIIRHWVILFKISRANHRRGFRYLNFQEGIQMFRSDRENSKKLAAQVNKIS
jgi:hypothetical protein